MQKGTIVRVAGRPGIFVYSRGPDAKGIIDVVRLDFDRPRHYWAAMFGVPVYANLVSLACSRCCTRKDQGDSVPKQCRQCDTIAANTHPQVEVQP